MKKQSIMYATLILTGANLLVRILGFVYRILLTHFLGAEGLGIYQMVFPTGMIFITLVASGFPLAVSRMVSQRIAKADHGGAYQVLRLARVFVSLLSLILCIVLLLGARFFSDTITHEPRTYLALMVFAPCIIVLGLSSIHTSYYHGHHNVWPSAISEMIEQVIRILLMLGLLFVIPKGASAETVALTMACMFVGELLSLFYLQGLTSWHRKKQRLLEIPRPRARGLIRPMLGIAVPITGIRLLSAIMTSVSALLIPSRLLLAGFTKSQALSQLGIISGMAFPLLFLPSTLTGALAVMMVPNLSALQARNEQKNIQSKCQKALLFASVTAFPASVLLYSYALPVCSALYGEMQAGIMLQYLAPLCILISLQQVFSSILHGLGMQKKAMYNYMWGSLISLGCIFFLVPVRGIGIIGYIIGMYLGIFVTCLRHAYTFSSVLKLHINRVQVLLLPAICAAVMWLFITLSVPFMQKAIGLVALPLSAIMGVGVYMIFVKAMGILPKQSLSIFPKKKH